MTTFLLVFLSTFSTFGTIDGACQAQYDAHSCNNALISDFQDQLDCIANGGILTGTMLVEIKYDSSCRARLKDRVIECFGEPCLEANPAIFYSMKCAHDQDISIRQVKCRKVQAKPKWEIIE